MMGVGGGGCSAPFRLCCDECVDLSVGGGYTSGLCGSRVSRDV